MTGVALAIVAVVIVGAVAFLVTRRRRPQDGVSSFRRHIDALSPEARREVIERVQRARETGKGK